MTDTSSADIESGGDLSPSSPTEAGDAMSPAPSPDSPDSDSGAAFDGLGTFDFDEIEMEESGPPDASEPSPSPASEEPPAEQEAQGATEEAEEEKEAAPQEEQGDQKPQAQEVQEAPAPSASDQPVGLLDQLQQHSGELIEALANERFRLSKEEEEALELDTVTAVPKLLAKVYFEATMSALKHLQTHVPAMVQQGLEASQVYQNAETAFFNQFKVLNAKDHGADVIQFANSFKATNPHLSQADLFNLVGAAVMAKHGLSPQVEEPAPSPPPKQQPFVPAKAGAPARITPEPPSPFAGLDPMVDFED